MSSPPTLLSTVQSFKTHAFPPNGNHAFSPPAEETCAALTSLIQTSEQLSTSLDSYQTMPLSNPKLVSLLRQQASISQSLHASNQNMQQTIDALRKRSGTNYGEDIPMDPQAIVGWCIERLQTWAKLAGLETYKEDGRETGILLAGTVLVVEVELSVNHEDPLNPKLDVASVKTSYAIPNSDSGVTSNTDGSSSLDAFLAGTIQKFCDELKNAEEVRDPLQVAKLGTSVLNQLRYLVMLDRLAAGKEDGGVRWFVDVDQLCSVLETLSRSEAEVVASSLAVDRAPLDIYLLRCHALPLPYLVSPSISFLVYVSPQVYLSTKKCCSPTTPPESKLPKLDIPFDQLRSYLSTKQKGVTMAVLLLAPLSGSQLFPASMSMPSLISRPTFSLVPSGSELEHVFPQTVELATDSQQHVWILDFTHGGQFPGVVMSQSRLREIELVVNPLSGMDSLTPSMMSFGTGSWVALLLNPLNPVSSERYTAIYRSPTGLHPPLQLRLTLPEEPGFLLGKVPVHSMKEVWGILEVVREQCWLNEILLGCHWTTEGLATDVNDLPADDSDATEDELHAILNGTMIPRKIPVNVSLPQRPDSLFDPSLDPLTMSPVDRRTRILMTCPERPPISGVVEITVAYDETRSRGLSVELNGAMGCDMKPDTLEEIARRGGTLGLSGRLWANSRGMS
ncbi:hypothetical protein GGX14DRAFT_452261 [Mycena pura]|uniref:Mediator of RNA polymerase II transcription subunit 1 n=1 Tax=Mycena pura TaxID=153505 RepID=A0AAD6VH83_9AGAR|nr:hypothetical protein GGX14DRAFT_452261 [Mycena pura]